MDLIRDIDIRISRLKTTELAFERVKSLKPPTRLSDSELLVGG